MYRTLRQMILWASLAVLAAPAVVMAQYRCTTNGSTVTITGYVGAPSLPSGALSIPGTISGHAVTSIGDLVFQKCINLRSVVIPSGVTNIGAHAFISCTNLWNVTIPTGVTHIGSAAFAYCSSLITLVIPNSVTALDDGAFYSCTSLTTVTIGTNVGYLSVNLFGKCASLSSIIIPASVTNIDASFTNCNGLLNIYFKGNAPVLARNALYSPNVYYLPNTTGWGAFTGPTPVLWNPQVRHDATFGILTNRFGFTITNAGSPTIVVEACTNLPGGVWVPVSTNTLTGGSSYFNDARWTNYTRRFYRFRSP